MKSKIYRVLRRAACNTLEAGNEKTKKYLPALLNWRVRDLATPSQNDLKMTGRRLGDSLVSTFAVRRTRLPRSLARPPAKRTVSSRLLSTRRLPFPGAKKRRALACGALRFQRREQALPAAAATVRCCRRVLCIVLRAPSFSLLNLT